jgi:hypothetical protein
MVPVRTYVVNNDWDRFFLNTFAKNAGLWIRIDLMRIRIQFWIQGFEDQKFKKNLKLEIFFNFFDQKLQFTYP